MLSWSNYFLFTQMLLLITLSPSFILFWRKFRSPWREASVSLFLISSPATSAGVTFTSSMSLSICWKRPWWQSPRWFKARCLNTEGVQYDMQICTSIRPGLNKAGSSWSWKWWHAHHHNMTKDHLWNWAVLRESSVYKSKQMLERILLQGYNAPM